MGKIDGVQQWLANIGIGIAWMGAEPCFNGVHRLSDGRKSMRAQNAFDRASPFVSNLGRRIHHDDCGRQIAKARVICAQGL